MKGERDQKFMNNNTKLALIEFIEAVEDLVEAAPAFNGLKNASSKVLKTGIAAREALQKDETIP